jgi:hypothetical protein
MAQELASINLVAPAFKGINTEDSPLAQDPSFAEVADNAVIDQRGRIAARKGLSVITTNKTVLGSAKIRAIKEFKNDAGTTKVFSVGNNKIISGTTTLVDETPGSYSISADSWKMVNFNDSIYFFQRGYAPLIYNTIASGTSGGANTDVVLLSSVNSAAGVTSAIYGNVVVYSGATAPASMTLADTISGVGCVDRDTVQGTGTDVLFLSQTGLKSFGRTIQEKSMPLSSLSGTITKDIIATLTTETESFRSVYHPEENFYLLTFTGEDLTFCFDLRGTLDDGSYRATRWPGTSFTSYVRQDNGTLLIGSAHGIGKYSGFQDNSAAYRFQYTSPELSFGDPAKLKFLKKLRPTIFGGENSNIFFRWAYDFNSSSSSEIITLTSDATSEYNVAEFNIGQFTTGQFLSRPAVNTSGSGGTLSINMESDIDGKEMSLQEINVLALLGKTI